MMVKKELSIPEGCDKAIHSHIMGDPRRECGGYLIGQLIVETGGHIIGKVEEIIPIQRRGSAGDFEFSADDMLDAAGKARYGKQKIVGTYHSHGSFHAFISGTDKKFLNSRKGKEFMLVVSPSTLNKVAVYKDENFKIERAVLLSMPEEEVFIKPYNPVIKNEAINIRGSSSSKMNRVISLFETYRSNEEYEIYTLVILLCLLLIFFTALVANIYTRGGLIKCL
jgi:proteasome lid subunit RPN8/RPN11